MSVSGGNTSKSAELIRYHAEEKWISLLLMPHYEKTAPLYGFSKMQRQLQCSVD